MTKEVCNKNSCCACSACVDICPKGAIKIKDAVRYTVAEIDETKCVNCNLCRKVCPALNEPEFRSQIEWHQGWSRDPQIRKTSSSGGIAQTLSRQFISDGGFVCSCMFDKGEFIFRLTDSPDEVRRFSGSKYVKSNPHGCYRKILDVLKKTDKNVLFIGLPCQVSAVKNFVGEKYQARLFTVDLICHGTPSVRVLRRFLREHGVDIRKQKKMDFRNKDRNNIRFAVAGNDFIEAPGITDEYSIAFTGSSIYTENCYNCKFARSERGSDITIGDAWSVGISSEMKKGVSLILCQTEKGAELIKRCDVEFHDVDLEKAIESNSQLRTHAEKPAFTDDLFRRLKRGKTLKSVVLRYHTKKCFRPLVKKVLITMHLY